MEGQPSMANPKPIILLIEDETAITDMYAVAFGAAGYQLEIAHNIEDGLEKLHTVKPLLILLDLILPRKKEPVDVYARSGHEILKKAKEDPTTKDIPVVILTNLDSKVERDAVMALGAVDYLVKSALTPKELIEAVKKYFNLVV